MTKSYPELLSEQVECNNIVPLINSGNSCYLDSILFAMFIMPNSFLTENILLSKLTQRQFDRLICEDSTKETLTENSDLYWRKYIQKELIKIVLTIRGKLPKNLNTTCTDLKNLWFDKCGNLLLQDYLYQIGMPTKIPLNDDILHLKLINDMKTAKFNSLVFLTEFLKLFDVDDVLTFKSINLLTEEERIEKRSLFVIALSTPQQAVDNTNELSREVLIDAPYAIFSDIIGIPEEYLFLNKNDSLKLQTLQLLSLIVFNTKNSHYTCYFLCKENNRWYHFNDLSSRIRTIGSYKHISKRLRNELNNGIIIDMVFYGRKENEISEVYSKIPTKLTDQAPSTDTEEDKKDVDLPATTIALFSILGGIKCVNLSSNNCPSISSGPSQSVNDKKIIPCLQKSYINFVVISIFIICSVSIICYSNSYMKTLQIGNNEQFSLSQIKLCNKIIITCVLMIIFGLSSFINPLILVHPISIVFYIALIWFGLLSQMNKNTNSRKDFFYGLVVLMFGICLLVIEIGYLITQQSL